MGSDMFDEDRSTRRVKTSRHLSEGFAKLSQSQSQRTIQTATNLFFEDENNNNFMPGLDNQQKSSKILSFAHNKSKIPEPAFFLTEKVFQNNFNGVFEIILENQADVLTENFGFSKQFKKQTLMLFKQYVAQNQLLEVNIKELFKKPGDASVLAEQYDTKSLRKIVPKGKPELWKEQFFAAKTVEGKFVNEHGIYERTRSKTREKANLDKTTHSEEDDNKTTDSEEDDDEIQVNKKDDDEIQVIKKNDDKIQVLKKKSQKKRKKVTFVVDADDQVKSPPDFSENILLSALTQNEENPQITLQPLETESMFQPALENSEKPLGTENILLSALAGTPMNFMEIEQEKPPIIQIQQQTPQSLSANSDIQPPQMGNNQNQDEIMKLFQNSSTSGTEESSFSIFSNNLDPNQIYLEDTRQLITFDANYQEFQNPNYYDILDPQNPDFTLNPDEIEKILVSNPNSGEVVITLEDTNSKHRLLLVGTLNEEFLTANLAFLCLGALFCKEHAFCSDFGKWADAEMIPLKTALPLISANDHPAMWKMLRASLFFDPLNKKSLLFTLNQIRTPKSPIIWRFCEKVLKTLFFKGNNHSGYETDLQFKKTWFFPKISFPLVSSRAYISTIVENIVGMENYDGELKTIVDLTQETLNFLFKEMKNTEKRFIPRCTPPEILVSAIVLFCFKFMSSILSDNFSKKDPETQETHNFAPQQLRFSNFLRLICQRKAAIFDSIRTLPVSFAKNTESDPNAQRESTIFPNKEIFQELATAHQMSLPHFFRMLKVRRDCFLKYFKATKHSSSFEKMLVRTFRFTSNKEEDGKKEIRKILQNKYVPINFQKTLGYDFAINPNLQDLQIPFVDKGDIYVSSSFVETYDEINKFLTNFEEFLKEGNHEISISFRTQQDKIQNKKGIVLEEEQEIEDFYFDLLLDIVSHEFDYDVIRNARGDNCFNPLAKLIEEIENLLCKTK